MRLFTRLTKVAAAASLAAVLTAAPAHAQEIGQDALSYLGTFALGDSLGTWDQAKEFDAETVLDHTREGFRPHGVRFGAENVVYPSVTAKTIYDDNIFLDPVKVGDLRSSLAGDVEYKSNLPRHMFKVRLNAETVKFRDHPNLDFTDASFRTDGRIDIDAADTIGASFQTQLGHDDNFLPIDKDNAAAAIPIWTTKGALGYMHDAGRSALAAGVDYQRSYLTDVQTYGGGTADEAAGDNDIAGTFALFSYRWSPGYRAFAAARIDREMLLHDRSKYGNNNSYRAEAGVVYELDPLLQFTLYGGYQFIKFDDNAQYDIGAATFRGGLQWLPTRRMTIHLDAAREMRRTVTGPTFGELVDSVHGRLEYDIYHNITGGLDFTAQQSQFIGGTRLDKQWSAAASLDYLFNENLALTLSYEHKERTSNQAEFDFSDNRYMARLKLSE